MTRAWTCQRTGARRHCSELGRLRAGVTTLTFSPDGARLASTGFDHTVRIWDLGTMTLEAVLQNEVEARALAFAHDGQWIAAVGSAVVRTWPIVPRAAVPSDPHGLMRWMAARSTATLDSRDHPP